MQSCYMKQAHSYYGIETIDMEPVSSKAAKNAEGFLNFRQISIGIVRDFM